MSESQISRNEVDIQRLLVGGCHLGSVNCTKQMNKYVYLKKANGIHLFDIQKQLEKIKVAAKIIASIPDPSTIIVSIY